MNLHCPTFGEHGAFLTVRKILCTDKLAVLDNAAPDRTPKNDFTGKLGPEKQWPTQTAPLKGRRMGSVNVSYLKLRHISLLMICSSAGMQTIAFTRIPLRARTKVKLTCECLSCHLCPAPQPETAFFSLPRKQALEHPWVDVQCVCFKAALQQICKNEATTWFNCCLLQNCHITMK